MLLVEMACRRIFLGGQEPSDQAQPATFGGAPGDMGEKRGFDRASDDPATEKERVYFTLFTFVMHNGDPDQTVVAEAILDADGEDMPIETRRQFGDLLLGVATRGEVELIGLLRQLCDAREREIGEGLHIG